MPSPTNSTEPKRGHGPEQFIAAVRTLAQASALAPMSRDDHMRCMNAERILLQRFTTTETEPQKTKE